MVNMWTCRAPTPTLVPSQPQHTAAAPSDRSRNANMRIAATRIQHCWPTGPLLVRAATAHGAAPTQLNPATQLTAL
eukprot:scaffold3644_cov107-Isochrysis_galbana.AAC.5